MVTTNIFDYKARILLYSLFILPFSIAIFNKMQLVTMKITITDSCKPLITCSRVVTSPRTLVP